MPANQYRAEFASALRCYNAMETTKRRHYGFLESLETRKKKFNIDMTEAEGAMLEVLLEDHNEEVQAFKQTCQALKQHSEEAHTALFEHITEINQALESSARSISH